MSVQLVGTSDKLTLIPKVHVYTCCIERSIIAITYLLQQKSFLCWSQSGQKGRNPRRKEKERERKAINTGEANRSSEVQGGRVGPPGEDLATAICTVSH